jgi:hypothetical protein
MLFKSIIPNEEDKALILPGDDLLLNHPAVIDSAFDLYAEPGEVFPWFLQLGKQRAGWYFPFYIEKLFPKSKRGLRSIEPKWQHINVGQRIPDYGGKRGYLECFFLEQDKSIGYKSSRGKFNMTWVISLWPVNNHTRVVIRLKIETSKQSKGIFMIIGKIFDRLTILGLAAGLRERLS